MRAYLKIDDKPIVVDIESMYYDNGNLIVSYMINDIITTVTILDISFGTFDRKALCLVKYGWVDLLDLYKEEEI